MGGGLWVASGGLIFWGSVGSASGKAPVVASEASLCLPRQEEGAAEIVQESLPSAVIPSISHPIVPLPQLLPAPEHLG